MRAVVHGTRLVPVLALLAVLCGSAAALLRPDASICRADGASATDRWDRARFTVSPKTPSMGDQVQIAISGLPPNHAITLQTTSKAQDGVVWKNVAVFQSNADGRIDLATQSPISGDYHGIDAMGIFWSMRPAPEIKSGDHAFFSVTNWLAPIASTLEVSDDGPGFASTTIERRYANAGIRTTEIRENGLVGCLWEPGDAELRPAIIVLGGSEGGYANAEAPMLASHGFRVLSLAYFGVRGLPPTLQHIPLEYFERALQWMRARSGVKPGFLALYGISRGAEAALTVAATYRDVTAVVARSPSHVRWEGTSSINLPGGPIWTLHGKPLAYVPITIPPAFATQFLRDRLAGAPIHQTPLFLANLRLVGATAKAEIPVEQIRGPLLLLSGNDDQIWPSTVMATHLMERLRRHRHAYPDQHLSYDGVGHWMPTAILPMRGVRKNMQVAIGGTPEQTARMQMDSWPKIVRFLNDAATVGRDKRGKF
jgi:dienelactone hydrolase